MFLKSSKFSLLIIAMSSIHGFAQTTNSSLMLSANVVSGCVVSLADINFGEITIDMAKKGVACRSKKTF